ncbi:MAG: hypothetical protein JKY03_14465 [Aureispira sp.]|nr:hypothetical protein [Aureispira sp.]
MHVFIFILGILSIISFPVQGTTIIAEEVPKNSFFIPIQQDSTPPTARKGVVKIKSLENPKKKKKTPKVKPVKKVKKKQVVIKESKSTTKVKKETSPKPKAIAIVDTNKTPPPTKKQQGEKLSTEEEIKLLSRTKTIHAENKIHPESAENCRFAFDVIDEFTGIQKKGLDARLFFAYTPDEYRKFIKENDFIRCEGFLSQSSEGGMALNINLYNASREAKQKFGAIKANSTMILRTMEGKEYYLMTYPGAAPQVIDNTTYYQCSFAINKSDLKNLQKAEIDQIKISFQKGFQSYDVFYLDFLIDQFPCFEK